MTSREPQNVYDDPRFFAGYSTLERFGAGWEGARVRRRTGTLRGSVVDVRTLDAVPGSLLGFEGVRRAEAFARSRPGARGDARRAAS